MRKSALIRTARALLRPENTVACSVKRWKKCRTSSANAGIRAAKAKSTKWQVAVRTWGTKREDGNRERRGEPMKPGTQDEVEGKLHNLKGKVKEVAGKLTNDPDLEAEGEAEEIAGKVQEKVGQVKKVLGK